MDIIVLVLVVVNEASYPLIIDTPSMSRTSLKKQLNDVLLRKMTIKAMNKISAPAIREIRYTSGAITMAGCLRFHKTIPRNIKQKAHPTHAMARIISSHTKVSKTSLIEEISKDEGGHSLT